MAVRDFTDRRGVEWRAWDVTPESIHPITKAEDYLDDCYRAGWVVFETVDGSQKLRLCPPPVGWADFSVSELEALVARSEIVSQRPPGRKGSDAEAPKRNTPPEARTLRREAAGLPTLDMLGVARSFDYPKGRRWVVCVYEHIGRDGVASPVLRFTSGPRTADLPEFPSDWADLEEEALAGLLRQAASRPLGSKPRAPFRRYGEEERPSR